jgi:hypothetical protein
MYNQQMYNQQMYHQQMYSPHQVHVVELAEPAQDAAV